MMFLIIIIIPFKYFVIGKVKEERRKLFNLILRLFVALNGANFSQLTIFLVLFFVFFFAEPLSTNDDDENEFTASTAQKR